MFDSIKLSDMSRYRREVLREPSRTRPALYVIEDNGVRAVVKDFSANGCLYRNTIGRFLVWRERKAYSRLRDLKGVPVYYGSIDGLALILEEIPGRDMEGLENEKKLPKEFFEELRVLVERIHRRGVAHCDLKRAPNILLGHDGEPYLVDWSASIFKTESRFFPFHLLYRRFLLDDFNAITKIQLRHCPESITSEEKKRYDRRSKPEKLIRSIRNKARALLQRIA
jgi:tRNA A-37 threonylcarbamoyl transferase component Bud32